ncbi:shikimate kinase [Sphingomonas zeicaulis]|uniref:shikimate kinase n=1 Tax=Sphingomonas zeicaulis TaxID=1632740 RepID=UPI003D1C03C6
MADNRLSVPIIVLVGPTGVGKSTLGPYLAEALDIPFFDVDQSLVRFRRAEPGTAAVARRQAVIDKLLSGGAAVIATGFEDFLPDVAGDRIRQHALSVFIEGQVAERRGSTQLISTTPAAPMSAFRAEPGEGGAAAGERIAKTRAFALPSDVYRAADIVVDIGSLPVQLSAYCLIRAVKRHLGQGGDADNWVLPRLDWRDAEPWHRRQRLPGEVGMGDNVIDRLSGALPHGRFEHGIALAVVSALLDSTTYAGRYQAYRAPWHSEGWRLILLTTDRVSPTIELFLFTHGTLPWQMSAVLHFADGQTRREVWRTEHVVAPDAEVDLAEQLLCWINGDAPEDALGHC